MVRHKRRYWGCVDCGSEINDESIRFVANTATDIDMIEFCDVCNVYNPEVVIKYA